MVHLQKVRLYLGREFVRRIALFTYPRSVLDEAQVKDTELLHQ